ncbi:MAG: BamA/TamA family outer membrane protein [Candidatus Coatesbacteria bacterium]
MSRRGRVAVAAVLAIVLAGPGRAINKVRYHQFEWKVLNTDHFEIYYYPAEEALAYEACQTAERAWQMEIEFFRLLRAPQRKVPMFLYSTFHDFIQTNVTSEPLGEGIGGFTEVYKTRVVLPLSASPQQRRNVITHELVHAHQFFILFGEGLRSYSLYKSVLVPQWFMEGMAEHVANDWDPQGEMVLRDAVLNDRLPPLTLLHSFNHLEPHDGYLGYKIGQSAVDYLGERYGEDKIPAILKGIEDAKTFAQVFQDKVGISFAEFDRRWRTALKEKCWAFSKGRRDAGDYGAPLVTGTPNRTELNGSPTASPADDTIAFFSDRKGYRNLFVMRKGHGPSALFGNASHEVMGSPPDWSPDGKRLAVVLKEGPRNIVAIVDAKNGRVRRRMTFPFMDIGQPRFSPDGKSIAFVGFDGIHSEVYLATIASGAFRQLTWDGAAASSPAFTPDGTRIVYASEGETGVRLRILDNLAADRPVSSFLVPDPRVTGARPDVSPDGRWVLFDSGDGGGLDLFMASIDGREVRQVTDARTGIWAGRWARDGKRILATTLEYGCQNIYLVGEQAVREAHAPTAAASAAPVAPPPPAAKVPAGPRDRTPIELPRSKLAPPLEEFKPGMTTASAPGFPALVRPMMAADFGAPSGGGFAPLSARWPLALAAARTGGAATRTATGGTREPVTISARAALSGTTTIPTLSAVPPRPMPLSAWRSGPDVVLSWIAGPLQPGISRYEIFRGTRGGTNRVLLAVLFDPSASTWRDNTWQYEEPYLYRVEGRNAAGDAAAAGEVVQVCHVDIWPAAYKMAMDIRLVDLFVLVGSVTIGGGTSFAGYGALQLSDLPGNNHLILQASAFPSWASSFGLAYEYQGLRPDLAIGITSDQTHFLLSPSIVSTEPRRDPPGVVGATGAGGTMGYPFDTYHRADLSLGVQQISEIFTDRYGNVLYGPKTSTMLPASLSLTRDTSRWRRVLPTGGATTQVGVSQALPVGGSLLRFTEYQAATSWYMGIMTDASFAVRWMGLLSHGHDQRYYYLGGRYLIRGIPFAHELGNAAVLGNHELRVNLFSHLNWNIPLVSMLLTDIQAVGFIDVGGAFDSARGLRSDEFRAASVGGGLNLIAFVLQSQPVMFSIEVARRIDQRMNRPTVYGRLGPVF